MYVEIQDVKNARRYAVEISRGVKGVVLETLEKYADNSLGTILFQVENGKPFLYYWIDNLPIKIDLYDIRDRRNEEQMKQMQQMPGK